ncbi:prolyl oligopeptidase family protein [Tanacetum coccineum]
MLVPTFNNSFQLKVFNGVSTLFWKDPWCDIGVRLNDLFPSWRLAPRGRAVGDLNNLIALIGNYSVDDGRGDSWSWSRDASGFFKVKPLVISIPNSQLLDCVLGKHLNLNSLIPQKDLAEIMHGLGMVTLLGCGLEWCFFSSVNDANLFQVAGDIDSEAEEEDEDDADKYGVRAGNGLNLHFGQRPVKWFKEQTSVSKVLLPPWLRPSVLRLHRLMEPNSDISLLTSTPMAIYLTVVAAIVELTESVLKKCETRERLHDKLTKFYDYPKFGALFREADKYFYFHNSGLQPQKVMYTQLLVLQDVPLANPDGTLQGVEARS